MADTFQSDNFMNQSDDFEKVNAPLRGEGDVPPAATTTDKLISDIPTMPTTQSQPQDGEVSTTTETSVHENSRPTSSSEIKLHVEETNGKNLEHSVPSQWLSSWLKGVDPRVIDLIYWRDVKKTGIVFGVMLTVLLCLAVFSLVSVVAYLSLALLTVTFSFVVYKKIMQAVQKSGDGHPFSCILNHDITLKEDKLKPVIASVLSNVNKMAHELRRLFLIEDLVDSVKFGLMLWVSTYIGSWMNGITIVILAVILIFTLPKVYETYQVQIDSYIDLAKGHIDNVMKIIQSKVPFLKKKEKAQ